MDVLSLALACSLHPDADLLQVLIADGSRENPYFVGDTVTLETYDTAATAAQAAELVARVRAEGGRPAVGLMAIPIAWAGRFGRSEADLFDVCSNVSIATAMLARFEHQCRGTGQKARTGGNALSSNHEGACGRASCDVSGASWASSTSRPR